MSRGELRNETSLRWWRVGKSTATLSLAAVLLLLSFHHLRLVYDDAQIFHDSAVTATATVRKETEEDAEVESCLRPRRSNAVKKSRPSRPFINLGMPKMGSTSLYSYFKCGGYTSVHCVGCSGKDHNYKFCGDCIEASIKAGLSPLSKCKQADSYTQIDRGPENLVQVNYLNEIVRGVPNATFILTFRNMTNWYISMTNWVNKNYNINLRARFERANITGLPAGVGRNVSEFSDFYCEYVKRVRKEVALYPGHELIEIDIEDPMVGWQMEEAFGINHTCWGRSNAGTKAVSVSVDELQR